MFSATMALKVEVLARKYLRNPVFLNIGDTRGRAAATVEQRVEWTHSEHAKKARLLEILTTDSPPFIVFCNSKKACDTVFRLAESAGISAAVLHGGKDQDARTAVLDAFKQGDVDVLVATDVLGRGIDVSGVQQVVNYELPAAIDRYTHRIGRTGRAGKTGVATSFIGEQDTDIMYDLKQMLQEAGAAVPPQLARHDAAQQPKGAISQKREKKIFAA